MTQSNINSIRLPESKNENQEIIKELYQDLPNGWSINENNEVLNELGLVMVNIEETEEIEEIEHEKESGIEKNEVMTKSNIEIKSNRLPKSIEEILNELEIEEIEEEKLNQFKKEIEEEEEEEEDQAEEEEEEELTMTPEEAIPTPETSTPSSSSPSSKTISLRSHLFIRFKLHQLRRHARKFNKQFRLHENEKMELKLNGNQCIFNMVKDGKILLEINDLLVNVILDLIILRKKLG